jgi:hypothetical protein
MSSKTNDVVNSLTIPITSTPIGRNADIDNLIRCGSLSVAVSDQAMNPTNGCNDNNDKVAVACIGTPFSSSFSNLQSPIDNMLQPSDVVAATSEEWESNPNHNALIMENINFMPPLDKDACTMENIIELYTPSDVLLCYLSQFILL